MLNTKVCQCSLNNKKPGYAECDIVICWNAQGFLDVWVVLVDILIVAQKKRKEMSVLTS